MRIKVKIEPKTNQLFLKHYKKEITLNLHTQKERVSTGSRKLTTFIIIVINQNETQRTFRRLKNLILNLTQTLVMCQRTQIRNRQTQRLTQVLENIKLRVT